MGNSAMPDGAVYSGRVAMKRKRVKIQRTRQRSAKPPVRRARVTSAAPSKPLITPLIRTEGPASVERVDGRVTIRFVSARPVGTLQEVDASALAASLTTELRRLMEHGSKALVRGEHLGVRLHLVLKEYAAVMQRDVDQDTSAVLASIAWKAVAGEITAAEALRQAQTVRGQLTWSIGDTDVSELQLQKVLDGSNRGRRPSELRRVAAVYNLLAWDCPRVSVKAAHVDGRQGRNGDLMKLLEREKSTRMWRKTRGG